MKSNMLHFYKLQQGDRTFDPDMSLQTEINQYGNSNQLVMPLYACVVLGFQKDVTTAP